MPSLSYNYTPPTLHLIRSEIEGNFVSNFHGNEKERRYLEKIIMSSGKIGQESILNNQRVSV